MTKTAGELLHHEEIETKLRGARAFKVRYRSMDTYGVLTEASGLVIAPTDEGANRPVFTWAHGTTGIGDAASPSAHPDPARDLTTYFDQTSTEDCDYGVPHVQKFIDDGWVVCATDYQGQGTPGVHQYLVNRTNGRDAMYIVHAAKRLDLGVGTELAGGGWSQGGGSIAALAELDPEEYGEFVLFAIAAFSPGVTGGGLALLPTLAGAGGPPKAPDSHEFMLIQGFAAANPTDCKLSDILTPLGIELAEATRDTQPVHHMNDVLARAFFMRGHIVRPDPQNLPVWLEVLKQSTAGQKKPVCPVLVLEDLGNPPHNFPVPLPIQDAYVAKVQELGGEVTVRKYEKDDHFSLCGTAMPAAKEWMESLRPKS